MQARGKASFAENYDGIADCVSKVYSKYGMRGFYRGLLPACYKIFISAGVMFTVNEKIKQIIES
jgi:hypothetical protein